KHASPSSLRPNLRRTRKALRHPLVKPLACALNERFIAVGEQTASVKFPDAGRESAHARAVGRMPRPARLESVENPLQRPCIHEDTFRVQRYPPSLMHDELLPP